MALLELCAFASFWPPIGHTYAREMLCPCSLLQTFPKTQGFCIKRSFLEKNSLFSIKTTFAFIKNSNPDYCVLEKKMTFGKIETPAQGGKGLAYRVSGVQTVGLQAPRGSRSRLTGSQVVRVLDSQGVGLQGPKGSRGSPTGSQG